MVAWHIMCYEMIWVSDARWHILFLMYIFEYSFFFVVDAVIGRICHEQSILFYLNGKRLIDVYDSRHNRA
jgi:hypothetical protein